MNLGYDDALICNQEAKFLLSAPKSTITYWVHVEIHTTLTSLVKKSVAIAKDVYTIKEYNSLEQVGK